MNTFASAVGKAIALCAAAAVLFLAVMILRDPVSAPFYVHSMTHPVTLATVALAWIGVVAWLLVDHQGGEPDHRRQWAAGAVSTVSGAILIAASVVILFLICAFILMSFPEWLRNFGPKLSRVFIALLVAIALLRAILLAMPRTGRPLLRNES